MKKCRVYHGTVAGKDSVFLESFIVTGAVSGKTENPRHQSGGFYVSLSPAESAYGFSHTVEEDEAQARHGVDTLRYGRGIIVELEVELDVVNWDIDHEMSHYSMRVIEHFKDELCSLVFNAGCSGLEGIPTEEPFFIRVGKDGSELFLHYKDVYGRKRTGKILFDQAAIPGVGGETFFLEQIHLTLRDMFPERYQKIKQKIFDEMVREGTGAVKYVGCQSLRVNKIFLRPEDSSTIEAVMFDDRKAWLKDPLARWEVVYNRAAPEKGARPSSPLRSPDAHQI